MIAETIKELQATAEIQDILGKPSFMHEMNRPIYEPLIAAGYVEWTQPHPTMSACFAEIRVTSAGRDFLVGLHTGEEGEQ